MKKKILVVCDSTYTKIIINTIEDQNEYKIFGIINCPLAIENKFGYKTIGRISDIPRLIADHDIYGCVLVIENNYKRERVYEEICSTNENINFIRVIHSSAIIGRNVEIDIGTIIMAGVVINSDSKVGKFCILNSQCSLGHEGIMNDFSSFALGVNTGGNLNLGKSSSIDFGANIIENISIGKNTVVGVGALVIENILSNKVVGGAPAKVIGTREIEEINLLNEPNN